MPKGELRVIHNQADISMNRRRYREPLRSKRLYREFVTAMVVETLQFFCGLTHKDTFMTFHRCHGLVPWRLMLAATPLARKELDATGLSRGASRSPARLAANLKTPRDKPVASALKVLDSGLATQT
jgi:hypothetical protein